MTDSTLSSQPPSQSLEQAIAYLEKIISDRISTYFSENQPSSPHPPSPYPWETLESPLHQFIQTHELNEQARIVLLVALAPHIQPNFFDRVITAQLPQAGDYPQIGGWRGKAHRGFLPTGETVLFILSGDSLQSRLRAQRLFNEEHIFAQMNILYLDPPAKGEPLMSGKLVLHPDYVDLFTQGSFARPHFSLQFPAQRITTEMEWHDVVLAQQTTDQLQELQAWINHGKTILHDWKMKKQLQLGYRALFYGLPGTGKTLAASLLGKSTGKDVYKIDISMVVSKFIGETEKNLSNLFARAENKDWILFFDEADALFGKRTNVRDAHDKYANQEVSYLLQRVENYDGLVILASNFKDNIDKAFIRRFQSVIHFPLPTAKERIRLWQQAFPSQITLAEDVNLSDLAETYELTGADIVNVVQYCCLKILQNNSPALHQKELLHAIKREFSKAGKIL